MTDNMLDDNDIDDLENSLSERGDTVEVAKEIMDIYLELFNDNIDRYNTGNLFRKISKEEKIDAVFNDIVIKLKNDELVTEFGTWSTSELEDTYDINYKDSSFRYELKKLISKYF
jgi:hypothetical protein